MEEGQQIKRYKVETTVSVSWLNLHLWIQQRDIRKIIYRKLDTFDRHMVHVAHNSNVHIDKFNSEFINHCAAHGYFSLFLWLRNEIGCSMNETTCLYAAQYGSLNILEWLKGNGYLFHTNICAYAALGGHLEILKWLNKFIICTPLTSMYAAISGNLEIFEWLKMGKQLSCKKQCLNFAKMYKKQHVIDWINDNWTEG